MYSAKCCAVEALHRNNSHLPWRPESYFANALKAWGFDRDLVTDLLKEEVGLSRFVELCTRHFKLTPELEKRYFEFGNETFLSTPESVEYWDKLPYIHEGCLDRESDLEWEIAGHEKFLELCLRSEKRCPEPLDRIRGRK